MEKKVALEVRSRRLAKEFKSDLPWAAISVSTEVGDFPELNEENRVGLLRLRFWDIANPSTRQLDANLESLFSKEQAKQIIAFMNEVWDKADVILVHCEAGMSRSPAIAAAIEHIKYGPEQDKWYFKQYIPNYWVYKTILEEHYGVGTAEAFQVDKEAKRRISQQVYDDPNDMFS